MKNQVASAAELEHRVEDLVRLFDSLFDETENTRLLTGADEPLYLPSTGEGSPHRIYCRADYFASALHEIAHWCLAGAERRLLEDYGYWYVPDGRSEAQQRVFEQVEARPQALECLFAFAAGYRFRLSADNLGRGEGPSRAFADRVRAEMHALCAQMPPRASRFLAALNAFYRHRSGLPSGDQIDRITL